MTEQLQNYIKQIEKAVDKLAARVSALESPQAPPAKVACQCRHCGEPCLEPGHPDAEFWLTSAEGSIHAKCFYFLQYSDMGIYPDPKKKPVPPQAAPPTPAAPPAPLEADGSMVLPELRAAYNRLLSAHLALISMTPLEAGAKLEREAVSAWLDEYINKNIEGKGLNRLSAYDMTVELSNWLQKRGTP